jgi:hypothetical protein
MRRYYVETWDYNLEQFTPQIGVPHGPYTLWRLRDAIRQLRDLGYMATKEDPAVLIYCTTHQPLSTIRHRIVQLQKGKFWET